MTAGHEIRKRGFLGWFFLLLFVAFNLYMLISLVSYVIESSEAEIRDTVVFGIFFMAWAIGALILGVLAILTRGRKRIDGNT